MVAAVNNVLCNAHLLKTLLTGICVIGVYDYRRVFKSGFFVKLMQIYKILIVIVRDVFACKIGVSA